MLRKFGIIAVLSLLVAGPRGCVPALAVNFKHGNAHLDLHDNGAYVEPAYGNADCSGLGNETTRSAGQQNATLDCDVTVSANLTVHQQRAATSSPGTESGTGYS